MLSHIRSGMTRRKVFLLTVAGLLAVFASVVAIESASFTSLMRQGTFDTLDGLNFDNKFSTAKNSAANVDISTTAQIESKAAPSMGSDKALVHIVEFVDFACPYSKEESAIIRELAVSNPDRIWFQARHFLTPGENGEPLLHSGTKIAAEAAACAAEDGKYWAMYDALFANQNNEGTFSVEELRRYALGAGVDGDKYDECIKSGRMNAVVAADHEAGLANGVIGTPTFFVNGYKIDGAIPADIWQKILKLFK